MSAIERWIAIYVRVSTRSQSEASQLPDLQTWAKACGREVRWYRDTFTGTTMKRPDMDRLLEDTRLGRVEKIVVWRLDRLGRTSAGLTALFDDLQRQQVPLVSLREGFDLATPAGRLMASVIASMAQYETEVRGERVRAGQARARAAGKRWGGSRAGGKRRLTAEQLTAIPGLFKQGSSVSKIARLMKLTRPTIYQVLRDAGYEPKGPERS